MTLRHAGLPADLLNDEKVLVTTGELFALYRAISELSDDRATGINLGTEERMRQRLISCSLHDITSRQAFGSVCRKQQRLD
jgi:hypothetical protein